MRRLGRLQRHRDKSTGSTGELDRRLRYGGAWFAAASSLPLTRGALSRRLDALLRRREVPDLLSSERTRLARCGAALYRAVNALGMLIVMVAAGVYRPKRVRALIGLLTRTKSETLWFSDSASGRTLSTYFGRSALGVVPLNRLCRGVLILPERHVDYLRGHRREAVRRNLRRAAAAGITCEPLADRARAAALLTQLSRSRETPIATKYTRVWWATIERPETELCVALDPNGDPLAVAGIVVDEMVGLISFAMASSHEARWALHDHIVRTLIDRGVRYLVAEGGGAFGALGYAPSLQRYQHLHGYELRHFKPRGRPLQPARELVSSPA